MGGIHRNRSQNRLDLLRIKFLHHFLCVRVQLIHLSHPNGFACEARNEFLAPAGVLVLHEFLQFVGELRKQFRGRQPVGPDFSAALLGLLEEPGDANLDKFVEITRRDRQEFHAFEQRIARVGALLRVLGG